MAKSKGQILLAEMFGYVESLGGEGVKRGQLVPLDHHTSPLNTQEIQDITSGNVGGEEGAEAVLLSQEVRRLKRKDRSQYVPEEPRKSAHQVGYCAKCGLPMRADRKLAKHEARCSGIVQG